MRLLFKTTERSPGKTAKKHKSQTQQKFPPAIAEAELSEESVSGLDPNRRNCRPCA
ncbi:hypothetical protein [Laspinema palackyanum]|uniref:hypothetical protein n=1 Tax=Laspinema palackyanum TaxID=3231601 RepID=UPI00349FA0F0